MFYKKSDEGYKEALEGIRLKTLVYGEKTLMSEFRIDREKRFPCTAIRTNRADMWFPEG
jgi:hypothetical protein